MKFFWSRTDLGNHATRVPNHRVRYLTCAKSSKVISLRSVRNENRAGRDGQIQDLAEELGLLPMYHEPVRRFCKISALGTLPSQIRRRRD